MNFAEDRILVVHHDDLGASHSANACFVELCDLGVVTSGSVMVPCPWFSELASIARDRPDLDIGVHLTQTAEFVGYRWGPVTGLGRGLTDAQGKFWSTGADACIADPAAVETEYRAQIEVALAAGIDVTHLDSHMCVAWNPEFIDIFVRLGADYQLPVVLPRDLVRRPGHEARYDQAFGDLAMRGNPEFNRFFVTPFANPSPTIETYAAILDQASTGLNYCAFHFCQPGDAAFISNDATTRIAEYELFRSPQMQRTLVEGGYRLSGMRELRDAMRAAAL